MNTTTWLIIIPIITQFIAQLIAPTLAELVKSRALHRVPSPKPNQPKNLVQRMGVLFINFIRSPWYLPIIFIAAEIVLLFIALRGTGPLTRRVVFDVAADIGGICVSLISMQAALLRRLATQCREVVAAQAELLGIVRKLLDLYGQKLNAQPTTRKRTKKDIPNDTPNDDSPIG
jgi:hypothetical protein